jgi:hypothetical protein
MLSLISLWSCASLLLAGCIRDTTYTCAYHPKGHTTCHECPSFSAAESCVEVGPDQAGCDLTPVACH